MPVVVIERAELALQQGKYKEIWETLDGVLAKLPSTARDPDDSSYRLMSLLHAMAAIKYKGTLEPAKEELSHVQKWLEDTRVDQYTDVQVNIIRKYTLTSFHVTLCSEYDETAMSLIPKAEASPIPWQGLTDLRVSLLKRDMVFEAIALFKTERMRAPPAMRLTATSEFISSLVSCQRMTATQSLWVQAELHYLLAMSHNELGEIAQTERRLQEADSFLDEWCAKTNFNQNVILGLRLNVCWLRLTLANEGNQLQIYRDSIELLKDMEACNHLRTTSVYGIAMSAARKLSLNEGKPQYHESYLELHRKLEIYEEQVLGDLDALLIDHFQMLAEAHRDSTGLQTALEWINAFLEQYPTFSLPKPLYNLHRVRLLILLALGENTKESIEAIERLKPSLPNAILPDLVEYSFNVDWEGTVTDFEKKCETAACLVQKWMVEDLRRGVISINCALDVFGGTDEAKQNAANKSLDANLEKFRSYPSRAIFATLYFQLPNTEDAALVQNSPENPSSENHNGSAAEDPTKRDSVQEQPQFPPLSVQAWGERFAALKKWLNMRSESPVNGRQCLLIMLQDIRIRILGNDSVHFNARITEYERAINEYSETSKTVRDYLERYPVDWHDSLGGGCIRMCFTSKEPLSDKHSELLEKAEDHILKAIEGNLRQNHTELAAYSQRNMAAIYLLKLHIAVRKQADVETRTRLRDIGLDHLTKADERFGQVELASSWSNDLGALSVRRWVTKTHVPWESTQYALQLLMEGNPEPGDDIRSKMWEWVQKGKSQALASTMGLKRALPQYLVNKVKESPVDNELYEQMLQLERDINQALPRDRFHLRLKLDRLVKEMRTHESLRKLLDVREGNPLVAQDLHELLGETERPVILVDWFYLPSLQADAQTLMFTARAGSAPTVDTLTTSVHDVNNWVANYLDEPKNKDPNEQPPLYTVTSDDSVGEQPHPAFLISTLIEPLNQRSKRGDILILSPTENLHRIPLHALRIAHEDGGDTPLIHRNPVVYSHSHSILRLCSWASKCAAETNIHADPDPIFLNGASYDNGEHKANYQRGLQAIRDLSTLFADNPPLTELNAAKSSLISTFQKSHLFHIQTHCEWEGRPLEHCITFPKPGPDIEFDPQDFRLTSQEIFDLPAGIQLGSHFNLLACEGGLSVVAPGDEVFGLVAALLYSGATSAISTLWKIPDEDAAIFGRAFFEALRNECKKLGFREAEAWEHEGKWVDLAVLVQEAVRTMDRNDSLPMGIWGPFVMHGYWRMWVRKGQGLRLCREGKIIGKRKT
ncbi:hypothetical protein K469DRAFT_689723 [Zopfia rhizophila CBS 207.26]|uniref:CHAT domain-containing protein n=1 Tax=Zopfia rhizophila CBS 207.26 TaxID=1314779 RepID=A0A6A6E255_9PEZI|nr:hypothetical protein K469DRAFT_689723 [Zopfia rhizophila CBS 207.26]